MSKRKKALIFGVTGQDGSYLAELLLSKGYEVHGVVRRASTFNTARLEHLYSDPHEVDVRLLLHYGDILDGSRLTILLEQIAPDEIYNLAAQSHVRVSFDEPVYTGDVTGLSSTKVLETMRYLNLDSRYYQASSSEMFGSAPAPQNENSNFSPRSPYAAAKLYAHWMTKNYRESYGIYASSGILFNHESPRRGETFVTRKITKAVAKIASGFQDQLFLGNLDAKRDWGYAPDYVVGMWRMLQMDSPKDYVIGTGRSLSISDFLELAFGYVSLDYRDFVLFDPRYERPTEVEHLQADCSLAMNELGMTDLVSVEQIVENMIEEDMRKISDNTSVDKPIGKLWNLETR